MRELNEQTGDLITALRRDRIDQAAARLGQRDAHLTAVAAVAAAPHEPFAYQAFAQSGGRRWCDRQSLGQSGKALWPPRREDDK